MPRPLSPSQYQSSRPELRYLIDISTAISCPKHNFLIKDLQKMLRILGKMNKLINGKWKIHSFCPELSRSARVILEIRKGQEIRIINVNLKPSKEYSNSSV